MVTVRVRARVRLELRLVLGLYLQLGFLTIVCLKPNDVTIHIQMTLRFLPSYGRQMQLFIKVHL